MVIDLILEPISSKRDTTIEENDDYEEIIKEIIYNGNDEVPVDEAKLNDNYDIIEDSGISKPIDYVVITNESLKESFNNLITWKTRKGLRCEIKCVEEIEEVYDNPTTQEKIKSYIHDVYSNNGAAYILLGGNAGNPGVYILTLLIDDIPCDSKKLIIK